MLKQPFIKGIFILLLLSFVELHTKAQGSTVDSANLKKQLDVKDLLTKKQKKVHKEKKVDFSFLPTPGYSYVTGFAITIPANAVFTLNGSTKESSVLSSFNYSIHNQTNIPFQTSIWTKKDKFNIVLDYRYLNYPSELYGVRGKSKINIGDTIEFHSLKLHQTLLTKVAKNFYAGAGLYFDYYWNIKEEIKKTGFGIATEFQHYTQDTIPPAKETSIGPAFKLLYDSRDNPVNAFKGFYTSVVLHPSFKKWGSDANWTSLVVDARKYFSISKSRNQSLAFWGYYWGTFGASSPSFLLLPSIGWDDNYNTGRGYAQGRYRGKSMLYFESEFRFQITHNGLLGGVVFANLQNYSNELFSSYSLSRGRRMAPLTEFGAGAGIRIKMDKYSKTNVAIDCGVGKSGIPMVAVNFGEVF